MPSFFMIADNTASSLSVISVSRSGSLVWQGSAINRVLRTLIPFRGRFLVRGGFVTSVSLLPGRASAGLGLVPAHHILAASICLIGPGAHCDNMVLLDSSSATLPCSLCLPRSSVLPRPLHVLVDETWLTCTITDIKCVLSQRAFGIFCEKFHIPEEVHPVLPDRDSTMHERPAEKIGLYTRFFDFANFRLPLSTFLVDILRDPASKATDFSAQDYSILIDHLSPFWKFPEEFLCLVGLSRHYTLDEETYPSFVDRDGEGECLLLCIWTSGPTAVVQEKIIKPSVFAADPSFAGGDPNASVFLDLTGSNFLVSGIRTVIDPEFDI
ncbi:hypothetical protein Tco_1253885, partial [Tanacetum coccineum]